MFCTKCGRELADTETYCPSCGAMTASEPSALHDISTEAAQDQLRNEMADDAFKWGIVSLVCSLLGLLGFIFSFIAFILAEIRKKINTKLCFYMDKSVILCYDKKGGQKNEVILRNQRGKHGFYIRGLF